MHWDGLWGYVFLDPDREKRTVLIQLCEVRKDHKRGPLQRKRGSWRLFQIWSLSHYLLPTVFFRKRLKKSTDKEP